MIIVLVILLPFNFATSPHPNPLPKERGQYVDSLGLILLAKLYQSPLPEGEGEGEDFGAMRTRRQKDDEIFELSASKKHLER